MTEDDRSSVYPGALHPDHHALVVNPNETCGCLSALTTAVEPTSWGRVKALYR